MRDMEFRPTTASGCSPYAEKTAKEIANLEEFEQEKNWLENAIPMDVLTSDSIDLRDAINALFDELLYRIRLEQ